jgi:site-specific recombinase XerC
MLPEIEQFQKWLRRQRPYTSTPLHYTSDLHFFFRWAGKPPGEISVRDVDAYIEHSRTRGHSIATINRRLAALRMFYHFLDLHTEAAPPNPVVPRRHFIHQGERLPRDVEDEVLERLFAVITHPRDRAMFLLMLRCGLRVGEVRYLSLNDLYLQPNPGSLPRLWLQGKGGKHRVAYLFRQPLSALTRCSPANWKSVMFGPAIQITSPNGLQSCAIVTTTPAHPESGGGKDKGPAGDAGPFLWFSFTQTDYLAAWRLASSIRAIAQASSSSLWNSVA